MTAGRPRKYKEPYTFTSKAEKSDYDLALQICVKKGIDLSSVLQEALSKFILENQGLLRPNAQITNWLDQVQSDMDNHKEYKEEEQRLPPFNASISVWVQYVHNIKDAHELVKGRSQAEKIKGIYDAALENLKRSFWQEQTSKMGRLPR